MLRDGIGGTRNKSILTHFHKTAARPLRGGLLCVYWRERQPLHAPVPDSIFVAVAAELVPKGGLPYRGTGTFRLAGPGASIEHR